MFTDPRIRSAFLAGVAAGAALGVTVGAALVLTALPDDVSVPRPGLSVTETAATKQFAMWPADPAPTPEDDPTFDCRYHGNHICGPLNVDGYAPGLYIDGVRVDPWPVDPASTPTIEVP
ncbi:hypothetical protein SEA_CHORKPOP_64 [Mycobacterium phage Chorkpop]|uniref:Uncharacterized protein n=1 Tax=Mycobacterium phage Chorkpop TaxID=1965451 RepID=A0A1V0E5Z6_9CAUD|nr:hypothetical protein SEA_CHORKPOP_64 [Mycobacterium phage Chorkpop]